jgi:hypothetical protein
MAQIVITFDTKDKTMSATLDGAAIDNVLGCTLYQGYDEDSYRCEIMTGTHDKDTDIRSYTRLIASETKDGKSLAAAGAEVKSDFVAQAFVMKPKAKANGEDAWDRPALSPELAAELAAATKRD